GLHGWSVPGEGPRWDSSERHGGEAFPQAEFTARDRDLRRPGGRLQGPLEHRAEARVERRGDPAGGSLQCSRRCDGGATRRAYGRDEGPDDERDDGVAAPVRSEERALGLLGLCERRARDSRLRILHRAPEDPAHRLADLLELPAAAAELLTLL